MEPLSGLLQAINERDYDVLDEIMAPDFVDHHPGFEGIDSADSYKQALKYMHDVLDLRVEIDVSMTMVDKIVVRATLHGKHKAEYMGIPATGREVCWTSIEVYQLENGKLKSRFMVDDAATLLSQIGVDLPS